MKLHHKILAIVIGLLLLSITIMATKDYMDYLHDAKKKYRKAQVYLKTDVCTNTQYRSILGEYSQCDESEKIVETSPYVAAMYRVAHDFNTYCKSHVDRLWHFIEHNLWYIAGGSIALGLSSSNIFQSFAGKIIFALSNFLINDSLGHK